MYVYILHKVRRLLYNFEVFYCIFDMHQFIKKIFIPVFKDEEISWIVKTNVTKRYFIWYDFYRTDESVTILIENVLKRRINPFPHVYAT